MILGRAPNIVLGFLTALFNIIVAFHVGGFDPTVEQISVVNVFFGSAILLIANTSSLTVTAGVHAINQMNTQAPNGNTPGTALANNVSSANGGAIEVRNTTR